jgi:hypothetical protein
MLRPIQPAYHNFIKADRLWRNLLRAIEVLRGLMKLLPKTETPPPQPPSFGRSPSALRVVTLPFETLIFD